MWSILVRNGRIFLKNWRTKEISIRLKIDLSLYWLKNLNATWSLRLSSYLWTIFIVNFCRIWLRIQINRTIDSLFKWCQITIEEILLICRNKGRMLRKFTNRITIKVIIMKTSRFFVTFLWIVYRMRISTSMLNMILYKRSRLLWMKNKRFSSRK